MTEPTPIYSKTVRETGLDGDKIVARCTSLATFSFTKSSSLPPRPGQKPVREKKVKP